MIYVQIAAYKDPELLPTITDCLAKAKFKDGLTFGICWQKSDEDQCLESFAGNKRFRIDVVPWHKSRGLGWARSRLQGLYEGEDYTLQIDSHHRFAEHWDEKLLQYLELTDSAKPMLTAYAGVYRPSSNKRVNVEPYKMVAGHFTPEGTIAFRPLPIAEWRDLNKPIRARFVSGHFFFTLGRHCVEYRYDPNLYFAGDEINLSIRSFTLGYDLFHPHRTLIWHQYTRENSVKHWSDHTKGNALLTGTEWRERDALSKRRLRKLLQEEENDEDISDFGLGTVRNHRDYELYAGIDFRTRKLHRDAVLGSEPPTNYRPNSPEWLKTRGQRAKISADMRS